MGSAIEYRPLVKQWGSCPPFDPGHSIYENGFFFFLIEKSDPMVQALQGRLGAKIGGENLKPEIPVSVSRIESLMGKLGHGCVRGEARCARVFFTFNKLVAHARAFKESTLCTCLHLQLRAKRMNSILYVNYFVLYVKVKRIKKLENHCVEYIINI